MRPSRSPTHRSGRRVRGALLALVAAAGAGAALAGCSPLYVIRAGIAEARILAARRPIPEVVLDPTTDPQTRGKLVLVMEARRFARDSIALDVGDSYTSFTRLDEDTLALVLSAAHRDRLQSKTWWFPIVGHVPYKGYFDEDDALGAQADLEREGFDTYLRPTAAFSTLGWFADPLLSTLLRYDEVELVETVIHELSHNHLFVSGRVRFNESFATFVGRVGAMEFFCTRRGGGWDTLKCGRAQARWRDAQRFSLFLDHLVSDLEAVYGDPSLTAREKVERREVVFETYRSRFRDEIQPSLESLTFGSFLSTPLNNATLLARMRYYHRLRDFQGLYEAHGSDLARAVATLAAAVDDVDDPFTLLPDGAGSVEGSDRDE
jgi:predicted aminopeptidase